MRIRIKKEWRDLTLNNYYDLYYIMKQILMRESRAGRDQEHLWVIGLANNLKLKYIELVSLGSMTEAVVQPMQVFRVGLMKGVAKIIMVHNHPGENIAFNELKPSPQDDDVTDHMIQVGKFIEIEVVEHMIITERFFYSYKQSGKLAELQQSTKYVPSFILRERLIKEMERIAEEKGVKKGLKKGKREGKQEGLKEGLKRGKEEGKKEGKEEEREQMVLRAHQEGLPLKTIAALTNLTESKIKQILKRELASKDLSESPK